MKSSPRNGRMCSVRMTSSPARPCAAPTGATPHGPPPHGPAPTGATPHAATPHGSPSHGPPPMGPAFGLLLPTWVLPGSSGRDEEGRRGGQELMPPEPRVPHSHQTPAQHQTRGSDPDFGGSRAHSKVCGPKEWRSLVPHFETSNLTTPGSRIQGRVRFF